MFFYFVLTRFGSGRNIFKFELRVKVSTDQIFTFILCIDGPAFFCTQMIFSKICSNCKQPGFKRRFTFEGIVLLISLNESFLSKIFGVLTGGCEAVQERF